MRRRKLKSRYKVREEALERRIDSSFDGDTVRSDEAKVKRSIGQIGVRRADASDVSVGSTFQTYLQNVSHPQSWRV